jgi:hypothetical protein
MSTIDVAQVEGATTEAVNLLKRNSDDIGWEYGVLVDANNKDKVRCKFYNKEMKRGIHRLKEHVAHDRKNVKKCMARTLHALEAKEECKNRKRRSIMNLWVFLSDAWSDRKRRSIMNLCTNCADGTTFISSKEMSVVSHTSKVIFELVDKAIEDIGPQNVVQVVIDNASNNMGAKKLLEEKRPNIFRPLVQLTQST